MFDRQVNSLSATRATVQVAFMSGWSKQGVAYVPVSLVASNGLLCGEEPYPSGVRGLHLGGGHVLGLAILDVGRAVEASHLVVELADELDCQSGLAADGELLAEGEDVGLDSLLVCGAGGLQRVSVQQKLGGANVDFERVDRDLIRGFFDFDTALIHTRASIAIRSILRTGGRAEGEGGEERRGRRGGRGEGKFKLTRWRRFPQR